MVARLSERLATQGGSAEEWARLIKAYGVLGETDRARAIWAEAQQLFGGNAADLEVVRAAATQAGVAE
jgi:cytochrome c-type biogenesis protein CcmH